MSARLRLSLVVPLLVAALTGPALAASPSTPAAPKTPAAPAMSPDQQIAHLLNRICFGPSPREFAQVKSLGIDAFIQAQLDPDLLELPEPTRKKLAALTSLHETPSQLAQDGTPPRVPKGQKPDPALVKLAHENGLRIGKEVTEAHYINAVESPRQLQEVMVDFWFNHFNVSGDRGPVQLWIGPYEETIRRHSLGHFRDLVGAIAHSPAMLVYLDNWQNANHGLNENYAREIMELHTMGVDSGYTQYDVTNLAGILTGWGFRRPGALTDDAWEFAFSPHRHDFSDKEFLGRTINGSGVGEGEVALDLICRHPATAHHIAFQLAQYFVADNPPRSLVDRLTQRFMQTDGDIAQVLHVLFHSPEFWAPRAFDAKFKTPYQYLVSAMRATGEQPQDYWFLYDYQSRFGMPLYHHLTPDGYKNTQDAWLSPSALKQRIAFAMALSAGKIPQASSLPVDPDALRRTLGGQFSDRTTAALDAARPELRAAMILSSPEFMRH